MLYGHNIRKARPFIWYQIRRNTCADDVIVQYQHGWYGLNILHCHTETSVQYPFKFVDIFSAVKLQWVHICNEQTDYRTAKQKTIPCTVQFENIIPHCYTLVFKVNIFAYDLYYLTSENIIPMYFLQRHRISYWCISGFITLSANEYRPGGICTNII